MKYTFTHALNALYPTSYWSMTDDNDYLTLRWSSSNLPFPNMESMHLPVPNKNDLDDWIAEKMALEPMRLLRIERNKRLDDCRWVIEKAFSLGIPLPGEWSAYMQALRDLPETAQPKLDGAGELDLTSVSFPEMPATFGNQS